MTKLIYLFLLFSSLAFATDWNLDAGKLSYTAKHPLKTTHAESTSLRGKAVCEKGSCDFLVAVPVNSFKSGDSNRDLHMIQVTKGGSFPMITAKISIAEKDFLSSKSMKTDFEITFAGKTVKIPQVQVELSAGELNTRKVSGVLPLSLNAFSIESPSLLGMSIHDEVPVEFSSIWKK